MLNDILKNAGVESADTYHERLKRCTTNQCRTIILQQAEAAEERAGKIVLDLYKSGRLSDEQVDLFITSYANKMMMGASDSERQNRGNQDVYTQNGLKWTPVGLNSNPHINELITRSLLKRWSRENVPVETIANRLEQNQAVSNWFSSVNIDTQAALISQVTGLGSQAVISLITKGRNGKVLSTAERVKIENVVQQGGGNTLATRERVNSNIQETRRGNQSSQFGTHAQQERKLEQPVTANGQANVKKLQIEIGQQNKHIVGTNEYTQAVRNGVKKSILEVEPQVLLSKIGRGQQVGNIKIGLPGSKERINFNHKIGQYYDNTSGKFIPTTIAIVHYSKRGIHIVPARPQGK